MRFIIILLILLTGVSCQKYLDVKSSKSDVIPTTLKDFQALLDDASNMNGNTLSGVMPGLGIVGADDYFVNYASWLSQGRVDQNAYIWAKDIFGTSGSSDWNALYKIIFNCNAVMDGLEKLDPNDPNYNTVKGSALFFRSEAYFYLAQIFAPPYVSSTASTDLGIPLRTTADISANTFRASLKDSYDKIVSDLRIAFNLLPVTANPLQTRPVKAAAAALLSRTFQNMDSYDSSLIWSAKALSFQNTLLNYNTIDTSQTQTATPFPAWPNNKEIIHYALAQSYGITDGTNYSVDTVLIKSYNPGDLRKNCYYRLNGTSYVFKGRFGGTSYRFAGLSAGEQYFIHAEAAARAGDAATAISDLNTVLQSRYRTGSFKPYTISNPDSALNVIIAEKRKEFPFNGTIRWEDLRRLNKTPRFSTTLVRNLNGQVYTLTPGDLRWVYPLPQAEITFYNLPQNPR